MAEAQLLARCQAAVRECYAELSDLRATAEAARSHKTKCASLLAAATEAVTALEQLVAAAAADVERSRAAQQLAARVQATLGQSEALVKTHCHKTLFNKFASHLLSSVTHEVDIKFDSAAAELESLAQKARVTQQQRLFEGSNRGVRPSEGSNRGVRPPVRPSMGESGQQRAASTAFPSSSSGQISHSSGSIARPSSIGNGLSGLAGSLPRARLSSSAGRPGEPAAAAAPRRSTGPASLPLPPSAQQRAGAMPPRSASCQQGGSQLESIDDGGGGDDNLDALLIGWDELQMLSKVAFTNHGEVWHGLWHETNVAVILLGTLGTLGVPSSSLQRDAAGGVVLDAAGRRALARTAGLMQECRHPNLVLFLGLVTDPAALVTEYCMRGSLSDLLTTARRDPGLAQQLSWPRRIAMALDAAKGMLYLHGRRPPIVHGNINWHFLLVKTDWTLKLTEFQLAGAGPAPSAAPSAQSLSGHPRWQAPEVIRRQQHSKSSDVYAFGLVLWCLLTWQRPFDHYAEAADVAQALAERGERPALPDEAAAAALPGGSMPARRDYLLLVQQCWAEEPALRPSFEQIAAALRRIESKLPALEAADYAI